MDKDQIDWKHKATTTIIPAVLKKKTGRQKKEVNKHQDIHVVWQFAQLRIQE